MQHTWPPRIVSLTYGMVRNERKKRKKEKKDGNKTGMNESYKVQLKFRNALIDILKFSTQICCYEASLFYYCYHCSRCCWTGSSRPRRISMDRMCTCHSVVQNYLSDFIFIQGFCCPAVVDRVGLTGSTPKDGGLKCVYGGHATCTYVSTQLCLLMANVSPLR